MKLTPQDKQADFLRYFTILIITAYLVAIFGKWAFIAFGVFAFIFFAAWAYLSFLNPEDIIARRDNWQESEYGSAYEEWKDTGVDRRNLSKKSNSSVKPDNSKLCQPCEYTGVIVDAEAGTHEWKVIPKSTTK